ncbi:MAG: hypothetical protein FWF56_03420 [Firmicutes bacterium]|nr:hypothetical protein [Bacillota bacterium]MCL1953124.1 hypothetical protein [Bacillota bacterium]
MLCTRNAFFTIIDQNNNKVFVVWSRVDGWGRFFACIGMVLLIIILGEIGIELSITIVRILYYYFAMLGLAMLHNILFYLLNKNKYNKQYFVIDRFMRFVNK